MVSYPGDWFERIKRIKDRDRNQCAICGRRDVELHVHHITPLSQGGYNTNSNLITLCEDCHRALHRDQSCMLNLPPRDFCYYCSNCNSYYSIKYGKENEEKCPICGSELSLWIGENKD